MNVAIIGCGSFGYALALTIQDRHPVKVYDVIEEYITGLTQTKRHPVFFSDLTAHKIEGVLNPSVCVVDADIVIFAVPAQVLRVAIETVKNDIPEDAIILNVSKALEKDSHKRMSEVIQDVAGTSRAIATLSGGMLAKDVAYGKHVGADIGCVDTGALSRLEELFAGTHIHTRTTTDLIGVELCGSFKNVVAIAAGIIHNASEKAYVISKMSEELEALIIRLGGHPDTFSLASNAWSSDLLVTCYGDSRNRLFGELIARGMSAAEAEEQLKSQKKHAEGFATLDVIKTLAQLYNIKVPFCKRLHGIVYDHEDPMTLVSAVSNG